MFEVCVMIKIRKRACCTLPTFWQKTKQNKTKQKQNKNKKLYTGLFTVSVWILTFYFINI
jgi:hypothetical protein